MKYITPWKSTDPTSIYGALYDSDGYLVIDSLRKVTLQGNWKPMDSAALTQDQISNAQALEGNYLFLGHAHSMYGHFLLETMPMISCLIRRKNRSGIFLPWGGKSNFNRNLLDQLLDLTNISRSRIFIHSEDKYPVKARIKCMSRPLLINRLNGLLEVDSFKIVLNKIRKKLNLKSNITTEKIFLNRDESRINPLIRGIASGIFASSGFKIINPENYSLKEQIRIFHSAKIIAGYSGSQMHNSIFCQPRTQVICLGDRNNKKKMLANQIICNQISGTNSTNLDYVDNKAELIKNIENALESVS